MDKGHWLRCLLWHGWLPMLSGINGASPWAASAAESASYLVEAALGGYSSGLIAEWGLPGEFDGVETASLLPDHPNVWTDGSLVLDRVTGVSSSGAEFFLLISLSLAGIIDGGVTLVRFAQWVIFRLVGVFVLFLGLFNLFKGLRCGVLF